MNSELEYIGPDDKPALLGLTTPEYLAPCLAALTEMGYKVHSVSEHDEFLVRFAQFQYQVVVLEEAFACAAIAENKALGQLQVMPMNRRRHAAMLLVGPAFQTLNPMQAFQQSVHAVVNPAELPTVNSVIHKAVMDNDLFLNCYRETQMRIAQGKI